MQAASVQREPWRDAAPPELAQVVAKALQLGLGRLGVVRFPSEIPVGGSVPGVFRQGQRWSHGPTQGSGRTKLCQIVW